jgi:hypothetical protein
MRRQSAAEKKFFTGWALDSCVMLHLDKKVLNWKRALLGKSQHFLAFYKSG